MVSLNRPKQRKPCQGCSMVLVSSPFLQFCALMLVLSSIPITLTRVGNVTYANLTGQFGTVQYVFNHDDNSPKINGKASSASASTSKDEQNRNERKPSDITLTNDHDILYYGVLKNKHISTTSIQATMTTNSTSATISAESEKKSSKSNDKSNLKSAAKTTDTRLPIRKDTLSSYFQSGLLGGTQEGKSLSISTGDNHDNNNILRVIVTGMEHTGTTILSELIMSAPGLIGPFETGFLLAETPSDFRQVTPFFEWLSRTDFTNAFLGLSNTQVQILLQQPTHTDMYTYAMENSALFKSIPSEWYVDKTPHYVYSLRQVMERAGSGVKVVVSMKSYEAAYKSWVTRRNASEAEFKAAYQLFQSSVQEASKAFPGQIYLQDYSDLFGNCNKGNKTSAYVSGKLLFDWLGLEWKNSYFTGEDCARKGRNCNIASLLDN